MNGINITSRADYVCRDCPNRRRIVTENEIYDCHSHCENFKNERQKAINLREKKHTEKELNHLIYGSKKK